MLRKFVKYSPNRISQKDVEAELAKSREEIARLNQAVNYFHGNIDRQTAERLLLEHYTSGTKRVGTPLSSLGSSSVSSSSSSSLDVGGGGAPIDGLFLIRKCSASPDDFSLSMIYQMTYFHYRISHSIDAYYVLDDGPLIHGIDELIRHYQVDPHGLPCKLAHEFVHSMVLPSSARIVGNTNPLHTAAACVSEVNKVKLILKSSSRPCINEKDDNGRTALHIACEYDNIDCVKELIEAGALPNIRAKDGSTPLHTAAEFGSIQCLDYLLRASVNRGLNPMERNMSNNWVALHEAASRDHYACVNALLNHGLPDKPRTSDNQTPLDLALEAGHKKTINILRSHRPPDTRLNPAEFLHDSAVTREIAKQLLEQYKNEQGIYLVRRTQRDENIFVLSLIWNSEFFNYEICTKELPLYDQQHLHRYFYIDDGPYFLSLGHLIEHYNKYEDGLPGVLSKPINPEYKRVLVSPSPRKATPPFQHTVMNGGGSVKSSGPAGKPPPPSSSLSSSLASLNSSSSSSSTIMPTTVTLIQQINGGSSVTNVTTASTPSRTMNGNPTASRNNLNNSALIKAGLFKSRTLLNEQKRKVNLSANSSSNKKLARIMLSEIYLQAIIGEGEFGTVYKGTYNGKQVAVKKLKDCTASADFLREADIMGALNHPCILKMYGLVQDKQCLMMVQELMICSILEKLWQSPNDVTENNLKLWASQIALGMQHMEEQKIVHRDLAARNVLLASMSQIKISDFGLSRSTDAFTNAYTQKTEGKIPIKWYAPESIEHLKFTSKSDVWSYGVTLWEMFSYGDQPYGQMNGSEVYMYIQSGNRLQRPSSCPKNTYKVMLQCWEWPEELRPTFKELNQFFQNDSDYQKTLPILKAFR